MKRQANETFRDMKCLTNRYIYFACERCCAILSNQRDRFLVIDAVCDREIEIASEFATFDEHGAPTPLNELSPHFSNEDER